MKTTSTPASLAPPASLAAGLRGAALLATAALLPACAATGATTCATAGDGSQATRTEHVEFDVDPTSGSAADRLLAVGDFEAAARLYRDAVQRGDDSLVLREKLANARRRAAQMRAAQALDAAARGDADTAARNLAAAESYAPGAPLVRRTRAQLGDLLSAAVRARDLAAEASVLMERDPERAQDLLAEARGLDAQNPKLVSALREATLRAEAARAARRAEKAWESGRRSVALRELETARFGGRPVAQAHSVGARIEDDLLRETLDGDLEVLRRARDISIEANLSSSAVRTIRDRLVAALTSEAKRLQDADRPAVAALLETECRRLGAAIETPALDIVAKRAQIRIAISAFDDATGGEVDGLRLARDLAARLRADARGGGAALGVIDAGPEHEHLVAAYPRALRLTGTARAARVGEGPRNIIVRHVPVTVDSVMETNPAAVRADAELRQSETKLEAVRELVADAREELDRLEAIPFVRGPSGRRVREGQATYELRIARAESHLANLKRRKSALVAEETAARERLRAIPPQHAVPVYGEHPLEVVEFRKVAKVTVHLTLTDGDDTLLDADVTGTSSHDEIIAPALPEAGLEEDPDDTPDDAAMARDAAAHFAVVAAGRIREAAELAARRFLVDARAAERAGRTVEAAEGYALYLLATAEVASPRRADAARALLDLAGVRVPLRTGVERSER